MAGLGSRNRKKALPLVTRLQIQVKNFYLVYAHDSLSQKYQLLRKKLLFYVFSFFPHTNEEEKRSVIYEIRSVSEMEILFGSAKECYGGLRMRNV